MTVTLEQAVPAWHGDPALKAEVVERLRLHRAEDSIVQGIYQDVAPELASDYRGCAIGCTLPEQPGGEEPTAGWHGEVERLYGIPRPLGFLIDRCFEGLPAGVAGDFAVAVVAAVPVGAGLSLVTPRLMLDVLADPEHGVARLSELGTAQRTAVEAVVGLYERRLNGVEPSRDEWVKARASAASAYASASASASAAGASAAADAAAYAAYAASAAAADAAAYAAYAASAASAAVDAAVDAAAYSADAAAYAAYAAAHWIWVADRLIHHIATAPVGTDR